MAEGELLLLFVQAEGEQLQATGNLTNMSNIAIFTQVEMWSSTESLAEKTLLKYHKLQWYHN